MALIVAISLLSVAYLFSPSIPVAVTSVTESTSVAAKNSSFVVNHSLPVTLESWIDARTTSSTTQTLCCYYQVWYMDGTPVKTLYFAITTTYLYTYSSIPNYVTSQTVQLQTVLHTYYQTTIANSTRVRIEMVPPYARLMSNLGSTFAVLGTLAIICLALVATRKLAKHHEAGKVEEEHASNPI